MRPATRGYELRRVEDPEGAAPPLRDRARARLALRDFAGLDGDLSLLGALGRYPAHQATRIRAVMLLEMGRFEEALTLAQEQPAPNVSPELVAVAFEAGHHLGRRPIHGRPSAKMLERLAQNGYEDWVQRLRQLMSGEGTRAGARV